MIYDYLFYKSYQLAKRSKNFDDAPVWGGIWFIMLGVLFNIFTLLFIIEAFIGRAIIPAGFITVGKYFLAAIFLYLLLLYFKYNNRWQKIVTKYEEREKLNGKGFNPIIVLIVYNVLSYVLLEAIARLLR